MIFDTILVQVHGNVGLVTLNRPEALNALSKQLISDLVKALDKLESDDSIGCIVLTGSEKAFAPVTE